MITNLQEVSMYKRAQCVNNLKNRGVKQKKAEMKKKRTMWDKEITSIMRTPGIIGLSGKCPGKKLSFMVTFLIATAETPGSYSITLSTKRNGNLNANESR